MKRVNLFEMYQCGGALKPIGKLRADTVISDVRGETMLAESWLNWLLTQDHFPIVDNHEEAKCLRGFIKQLANIPEGEV
jgi:hypothetical protein